MRCPKCGAFLEEGKEICFMCGVNVKTYVPDKAMPANFNQDTAFGSGNDFRNPNERMLNNQIPPKNDYRNVSYAPLNKEDKDIFDKYQENKKVIRVVFVLVLCVILGFAGYQYYKYKTKEPEILPIFQNLYFEVDKSLEAVNGNGNGKLTYIKSGDKGNACSISITFGASTSEDHVYEYFKTQKDRLEPEKDKEGNIVNVLDIYVPDEGNYVSNDSTWYFLNIFYKNSIEGNPTLLRYKYLTSIYKGYYYDIELVNNSNDSTCNASLDNFAKSLKFIDT